MKVWETIRQLSERDKQALLACLMLAGIFAFIGGSVEFLNYTRLYYDRVLNWLMAAWVFVRPDLRVTAIQPAPSFNVSAMNPQFILLVCCLVGLANALDINYLALVFWLGSAWGASKWGI